MSKKRPHGQPNASYNRSQRIDREITEMLGLVKGVLADGVVTTKEVEHLQEWCGAHPEVVEEWPGSVMVKRLDQIFEDDRVSEVERRHLEELLHDLVGGEAGVMLGRSAPSGLPLDDPPPMIEVPDRVFVFTGRFAFGPRDVCQEATKGLGGWVEPRVTMRTDYVVLGTFASRDWIQSSHGRKIEKAVEYRDEKDVGLAIIGEDHWARAI